MKKLISLLALFTISACQHAMESWPSDSDRQEVSMYVRTQSLTGIPPSPTAYQFFIYDKENALFTRFDVNPNQNDHTQMQLKLLPGEYIGYCLTGAENSDYWIFDRESNANNIFLKTQKTTKTHEEAKDHLLGSQEFTVTEENDAPVIFDLKRKVGMLKVRIENIPDWITDLQINLDNIPNQMNLLGEYSGSSTVIKNITIPEDGVSETALLVFPPKEQATLSLSSNALVFISPEHPISSIEANRITEIKAIFQKPAEPYKVDITSKLIDWDDTSIQEEDWNVDLPAGACTGSGNGIELVANGGFEEEFVDAVPPNWKLDAANAEYPKTSLSVTTLVKEGSKAVLIEGKTYIYQEIPISGGECYQLHLYINAPHDNAKWKCHSSWYKGSDKLTSTQLQSSEYEKKTEGYIDFYGGKLFRAPANATKLRIEIRNYNDPVSGEGIYIDGVSVQAVD